MTQATQDQSNDAIALLRQVIGGLDASIDRWRGAEPVMATDFATDRRLYSEFWRLSDEMLAHLPTKPKRTAMQARAAAYVMAQARNARARFLAA